MSIVKKIHESKYKFILIEQGVGVPIATSFLEVDGCSSSLLHSQCPYDRDFMLKFNGRHVSAEYVEHVSKYHHGIHQDLRDLVVISLSGAFKDKDKPLSQTHSWLSINAGRLKNYTVHISSYFGIERDRRSTISSLKSALPYLIHELLLVNPEDRDFSSLQNKFMMWDLQIDCLRGMDISEENELELLEEDIVLAFDQDGRMQRPADILRTNDILYFGSFNPPTLAHMDIGKDALFCLSNNNVVKGTVSSKDLLSRKYMLQLCNMSTILVGGPGYFKDYGRIFKKFIEKPKFLMGADTFDRIADPEYVFKDVEFLVHPRPGTKISNRKGYAMKVLAESSYSDVSSTKVRNKQSDKVLPVIRKYLDS